MEGPEASQGFILRVGEGWWEEEGEGWSRVGVVWCGNAMKFIDTNGAL